MRLTGSEPRRSRRDFLALAGATAITVAHAQTPPNSQRPAQPQIGVLLATTYTTGTLEARLDEAKAHGLACVQVSMSCAGLPARILRETAARGLRLASVQGTFNMCHPDPEHRRTGLRRLRLLAEAFPNTPIHICTGTRDPNSMWRRHPENTTPDAWRDMTACVREATEIARQAKVVLAFEPEINNVVDSARKARRLLDEIGSPHLKLTIDPANLFPTGTLPRMQEILEEAFTLLGKEIALAHAKDLAARGRSPSPIPRV